MTEPTNLTELRDWFAARDGWVEVNTDRGGGAWRHSTLLTDPCSNWGHPYPATLDAAAGAMPEGYNWFRVGEFSNVYKWSVLTPENRIIDLADTGDEIHDRYLLAYRACEAMDKAKEKAQ